uniref:Beta-defensin-like domain-containing protein n=1 Tax=Anolis carolinensis TaxID=28377 RepID=A0A803TH62_ANOCA
MFINVINCNIHTCLKQTRILAVSYNLLVTPVLYFPTGHSYAEDTLQCQAKKGTCYPTICPAQKIDKGTCYGGSQLCCVGDYKWTSPV